MYHIFLAVVIECYEWLLCWLLDTTSKSMHISVSNGLSKFEARNNAQVYKARELSRAYSEYYSLKSFQKRISLPDLDDNLKPILQLIFSVYAFWSLEKHLPTFYQGCFATGDIFADAIRTELLNCCKRLKDSAVTIADSIAPPDFVLNSVIGKSDGLVSCLLRIIV